MDAEFLLGELKRGILALAQASPDGVKDRNDVGFSGSTLGTGMRLAARIDGWSVKDALSAWRICRTHNAQLGGVIPERTESALQAAIAGGLARLLAGVPNTGAEETVEAAVAGGTCPFELAWSKPKLVRTQRGERVLKKAAPNAAFWAAWRAGKGRLKSAGYSIGKDKAGTAWEVCLWQEVADDRRPEMELDSALTEREIDPTGLRPYQIPFATRNVAVLRHVGGTLDRSDLGTGKTYTNLVTCREVGCSRVMVVGPVATRSDWYAAAKHVGIRVDFFSWEAARNGRQKEFVTWHPEAQRFSYTELPDAVIFDEIHRAKSYKTLNSRLVRDAVRQRIPVLGLSGTPYQTPLEARAAGTVARLFDDREFFSWATRFGCRKGRFGWEFNEDPTALTQVHDLFSERGIRIRKTDPAVAANFPTREIVVKGFDGYVGELERAHAEMQEELVELEAAAKRDKRPMSPLTVRLRMKQKIDLLKVPLMAEMARDAVAQGYSVVLGANFAPCADALLDSLSDLDPARIVGGMSEAERVDAKARFSENRTRAIVVNYQAGSAGLNLQDRTPDGAAPRITIGPPCATGALNQIQFWGRTDRSGTKGHCLHYVCGFWQDKHERAVLENVAAKATSLALMLDGVLTDEDLLGGLE